MEYTHGGDIWSAQTHCGKEILDFSANLSPLGMPRAVARAAEMAVADAVHYPDPLCRKLVAAIASHDGVATEQVLCGNGAADLIFRLAYGLRPQTALITAPTFSEYRQALEAVNCKVLSHRLLAENDFALTEGILKDITEDLDICFLCTPNNPTGRVIEATLMERILARCAENHVLLVVDECFLELTAESNEGLAGMLDRYPNLVLLRAFTKSYAMPGLRLGYCLTADAELLEKLTRCGQPWSVSGPAQAAGLAALEYCPDHPKAAQAVISRERKWLTENLKELGLKVFPSEANYLLFHAEGVFDLKEQLIERGILIRSCANYEGLGGDDYRIAVRPHKENTALISALKEVL
ncbi:MAG: threonine-phosphate decarboxylase CobD [Oscillospiraceae bacterium]